MRAVPISDSSAVILWLRPDSHLTDSIINNNHQRKKNKHRIRHFTLHKRYQIDSFEYV